MPLPPKLYPLGRLCLLTLLLAHTPSAAAGDPEAGRIRAQACRVCHGMDGISVRPDAPNIGGQPATYLRQQLLDYRSGRRQHPVMSVVAKDLSDADIENLAAYYSSISAAAEPPSG